ncbi:MAG: hypothetical protein JWR80_9474 [Bradyrhizobium sp.]|nr:hypothetical protein [Bradyrhizobium sp.]
MALTRFGEGDRRLGQLVSDSNGANYIPAIVLSDTSGNVVGSPAATAPVRLLSSAASDNATSAIAVACTLRHVFGFSARATNAYLKLYDKATAPSSSDTPLLGPLALPPGGFAYDMPQGLKFTLGLGYRIVTGTADNDTGAVALADIVGLNLVVA